MKTTINTYAQLIEYIRANKLNVSQTNELITHGLNVVIMDYYKTTEDLLLVVDIYWSKWRHHKGERPIFLEDLNIDVKNSNIPLSERQW
jgi:hypothetical protein